MDAWLSREMGGSVGSAPACYGSSLGSLYPDIFQKYKKKWPTHSSPPKNQINIKNFWLHD
jgi:hypothetical protein